MCFILSICVLSVVEFVFLMKAGAPGPGRHNRQSQRQAHQVGRGLNDIQHAESLSGAAWHRHTGVQSRLNPLSTVLLLTIYIRNWCMNHLRPCTCRSSSDLYRGLDLCKIGEQVLSSVRLRTAETDHAVPLKPCAFHAHCKGTEIKFSIPSIRRHCGSGGAAAEQQGARQHRAGAEQLT